MARDLGVSENTLCVWKKKYLEDIEGIFPGKGNLKPEEEEIRRLKRELDHVKMERNILKNIGLLCKRALEKYNFILNELKDYPLFCIYGFIEFTSHNKQILN